MTEEPGTWQRERRLEGKTARRACRVLGKVTSNIFCYKGAPHVPALHTNRRTACS